MRAYTKLAGVLIIVAAGASPVGVALHAQTQPAFNAVSEADAGTIDATLSVAGVPVSLSQPPVDEATNDGAGTTDKPVGNSSYGLPGVQILTLSGGDDQTSNTVTATGASASGTSTVGSASLLGGLVQITNLHANAQCSGAAGTDACHGDTTIGQLVIAGQPVALGQIAPNTSIQVPATINVDVGGQSIPLSGTLTLTLNDQKFIGDGVNSEVLVLEGARLTGIASAGLVQLNVDIALAGPVAQTAEQEPFTCPVSTGLFPDPSDASRFFSCSNSMAYRQVCPLSLFWNNDRQRCDVPDQIS
jgi:hypothetical protein